ncbi:uncharacterized protein MONOS_16038p1 [Monocercomonoides exilis]|uniref:uncharacterized protein n=1 Tax=Monocercomonoides exilis TaxID=2049356 RepID=UPI00355963C5|nr:hypothetical protein MONOS_16038p1 [Monocercomonoides exilis]
MKMDWLKDKTIYVSVKGSDGYELCGANESNPCLTVKKALEMCEVQISLAITLMEGDHTSEATTIEIGSKKISVIGKDKEKCSIGTGALSSPSAAGTLFSVTTGHLGLLHIKVDCNSNLSPSSPSVVVVSDGSGSLSLEDVITTSVSSGDYVMSSSVFVVPLSQLSMVDVEIKDMNVAKPLFSELDLSSPSSSSSLLSLSSTALYLTATASGDSVLANVKVTNVKLTEGDGVVVAKSVKAGETFVVKNVTIEDCECKTGSGGGIKVELESSSSKLRVGSSTAAANEETKLNRCKCNKYGGGMMLYLENIGESSAFDISMMAVDFSGCTATLGGKFLFVNGSNCVKWGISSSKFNVPRNTSAFDELEGFDRSDEDMKKFPLNVFLDTFPAAAHVGKAKNQLGGYDSQFCGFAYYPCATITHAAQLRYAGVNKKIELDSGLELAEVVSMSDAYKWEIFCTGNEKSVKVVDPETTGLQYLIDVQSECSISSIDFSIPTVLSGAPSLILANSTLLTLSECSVVCSSNDDGDHSIGYVFVKAIGGDMILEKLLIDRTLVFESSSLVQFVGGVNFVRFSECKVSSVEKKYGNGGWVVGTVGVDRGAGLNGRVEIDTCTVKNCKCHGKDGKEGRGGGLCVSVTGEGSVVVNGSTKIDGCEANKLEANEGTGGGLQLEMLSTKSKLEIASEVKFSSSFFNKAKYGKDVFVSCGSGVLLDSKIDATTFKFFDSSEIPTDVLKLCGSEDGNGEKVIPLFVYLFTIESKLTVDGSGERALDHSYCGFEKFGCETINYCMSTRVPKGFQRVEVSSESSIKDEVIGPSFDVSVSGKVTAGEEITRVKVNVVEEGSSTQDWFVGCSNSLTISSISFVVKGQLSSRRRALIHSSSTLRLASCSVSFESGAFTGGKIGYNVLNVAGGELIVDGLMMESVTTLTMNGKSPITISNGEKLEIKNSRVSGVTVEGGSVEGRGCISAAIKEGGSAVVDNCSISTTCTGGGGMKGGGMMISAENGGSLEINSVTFTGCQVPTEDNLQKGRGMGGGMFVELADTMGSFQMEGVTFSRCNAWKGKKVFISGNELDDVMSNEQLKWGLSASDEKSLDELCGWERASTDEGYVIPLVVYLWRNWSKDGFVSNEKGGDFSGCGFSEAPCSSINHLISLRYSTLGKGESQISIGDSGLLSHSISFLSSLPTLPDSEAPAVVIKGTKKGTAVTISDEDGNDLKDSMISSNVSLSFVNVSFTKPSTTTNHAVFIESSGTNSVLSVTDCSFGSAGGNVESFECCLIKVNGGSAAVQSCTLNKINELKGFIAFSQTASQVTIQNVNISSATLKENSLISMIEEENQMNGNENTRLNGNKPVLKVVYCSFENIINEGSRASAIELGSFDYAMKCTIEDCTMSTCRSDSNTEGGGMKLVLKSEESVLKVNGSTFSTCRCSTGSGRGGGLYIDGADPRNVNIDDESQIPSLNFKIVNILFRLNDAFVGKDIFIKCHSIGHQINETLFSLNYNQESLGTNNSICGSDSEGKTDMDVIPLITFFKRSSSVFEWVGG